MRASRVLGLSGLAVLLCMFLAACGGSKTPTPTPAGPPVITTATLTQATVNVPYVFFVQATGGTGTYTWAISAGTLPPGLSFSDQTAEFTGTPTLLGSYPLTIKVTDQASMTATANFTLVVGGALIIDCNSCVTGTLTLPTGNPGVPYSATLSVSGGVAPYTWCVIESSGACDSGSGGGLPPGLTISTNGIISGTPTTPGTPTTVTVQVTDSEQIHSSASAQLSLTIMGIVTTALPPGFINIAYSQNMTVAGGRPPYTWTISSGQLPPGLSLVPGTCVDSRLATCTISGTPTVPSPPPYTFTAQVTDGETPPAVATQQFTITVAGITNATLNGNYVFSFNGYNGSNSSPLIMAGAFVADGNGDLAPPMGGNGNGGEFDLNSGSGETNVTCPNGIDVGPQPQVIIPGPAGSTYSLQPNGLGTMTIVTSSATYNFQIAIRPDGSGSMIQNNADPNTRGSGTIKVQTKNVTVAQIEGNFVYGVNGADPSGSRYSAAGRYSQVDQNGDLSNGALDVDDAGTTSQQTFLGTLSVTLDPFGRGCNSRLTFNHNNNEGYVYTYYIISANELVLISTDPVGGSNNANLTLWSIRRQIVGGSGFNNGNLAGTTVLELSAQDTNGDADVTTGLFVGQGTSSNDCQNGNYDSATFSFDENQGGTLNQQQSSPGTYCVDTNTGRVTLQGFSGWSTSPPVFYLGGNDPGFVVGTDAAVTSGIMEAQTGASLNLDYWGGTFLPPISAVTDSVTSLIAGNGNITATQYTSGPGGPGGPTNLTLTYSVDNTGRAVVMQNGNIYGILYVVSPTKFILLPASTTPVLNVFAQAGF